MRGCAVWATLKATTTVAGASAENAFCQIAAGWSSSTFSPVSGSKHSATWLNQTLKKSVSSVIVPTVEREVFTVLVCWMAMEGRMFSMESTRGLGSRSRNCRV